MYQVPPCNATTINAASGQTIPVRRGSWDLFSSAEDDAQIIPLMKACDPNVRVSDGADSGGGGQIGPVTYGTDGRKITLLEGMDPVSGLPYIDTVGQLLQARGSGPMWNFGHQPDRQGNYSKIVIDVLGDGVDTQVDWSN